MISAPRKANFITHRSGELMFIAFAFFCVLPLMACNMSGNGVGKSASDTLQSDNGQERMCGRVAQGGSLSLVRDSVASQIGRQRNLKSKDTLTLCFTGDVMLGTTYGQKLLPKDEGKWLFKQATPIFHAADFVAGNLECVFGENIRVKKKMGAMSYAFLTPPSYAKRLKEAGFRFMSVANNHSMDFGDSGVWATEKALIAQRIAYAGIKGRTKSQIVEIGGVKYGVCAFGHNGYTESVFDLDEAKRIIQDLRERGSQIVVVSMHIGAEGVRARHLPNAMEMFLKERRGFARKFAHGCIDAGADVVYGHGPHVLRAMEKYKGHLIAYSLGNFCTPYGISLSGKSGLSALLEVKINSRGEFLSGKIHSFKQSRGIGPRLDSLLQAAKEVETLTKEDISTGNLRFLGGGRFK